MTTTTTTTPAPPPAWALRGYRAVTTLFFIGVMLQVFFAGAGVFVGGDWMMAHIGLGHCLSSPIPMLPLAAIVLSFIARLPRQDKALAAALFVFALIQPIFVYMRGVNPMIAAFHPVNAMFLVVLPLYMLLRTRRAE